MTSRSKQNILRRLRSSPLAPINKAESELVSTCINNEVDPQEHAENKQTFIRLLNQNQAQVIECTGADLAQSIHNKVIELGVQRYALSQHPALQQLLTSDSGLVLNQSPLSKNWPALKAQLFDEIELSICYADAAICAEGALLVKADATQARNLSLIPAINCLVLKNTEVFSSLAHCVASRHFEHEQLPSNMFFISGPSKTADIQQTLAYGAHGPRTLVVFLVS